MTIDLNEQLKKYNLNVFNLEAKTLNCLGIEPVQKLSVKFLRENKFYENKGKH